MAPYVMAWSFEDWLLGYYVQACLEVHMAEQSVSLKLKIKPQKKHIIHWWLWNSAHVMPFSKNFYFFFTSATPQKILLNSRVVGCGQTVNQFRFCSPLVWVIYASYNLLGETNLHIRYFINLLLFLLYLLSQETPYLKKMCS